jgi:hypothetical protein
VVSTVPTLDRQANLLWGGHATVIGRVLHEIAFR